jgi:lambda family phage portal protein
MGLIRQFLRDYGYIHKSDLRKKGRRAYTAARMDRLTSDWGAAATSIDNDIRAGMVPVRSRARDLSQNNEYAKAYLRAVRKNIVGSDGFALQVKSMAYENGVYGPDKGANTKIERAFKRWSFPDFATVTGKLSFRKVQEVVVETVARDGECFIRLVKGRKVNRFGFSLQLIEPEWVDEKMNKVLPNGRVVRLGVEVDAWRKPVAYHVSTSSRAAELYGTSIATEPYVRIPAEDMIHVFDPERGDQTRGISWMTNAMLPLHNLKGYTEAAVINARVGASKMGFFRDPEGTGDAYTGDTTDAEGRAITTVEPGVFEDIGTKEFQPYDPRYPDAQFDPFTKSILRGISAGLGVSFSSISNDLTEVNFSSIRAGLLEERETWKSLQSWFIESFLNRVFSDWLYMALLTGEINLPSAKYDKFNAPKWTGRRWSWVKPLEEVKAAKEAVAAGFKSATQIVSENGGDLEELYQELEQEKLLAEKHGLKLDIGGAADEQEGTTEQGDSDDLPAKGDDKRGRQNDRPGVLQ